MIIGMSMGLETCQIHGQVSHNLIYWKKNLPTDICGPGEINEKTADIQARSFMARTLGEMGKNAKLKEKQKWSHEKPHLDIARKLRGIYLIFPMPQAMKIPAAKAAVDKEWEKLEKISAWNLTKVRSKKEAIDEARTKGTKVHFASLMDICHLKNAELEAKHQKYKGRVVLRGDMVKDDSGSYAVFTEQGSSASQMTAAKVMDIISRLLGCAGQAADAVSAYTQVKM